MTITRSQAEAFRDVIGARLGLHFDDSKLDELAYTLRARMDAVRAATVDAYVAALDARELGTLAEQLTVGETYFFRYREQFAAFAETVLPTLRAEAPRPLRILSAGCATGEEPYTLAILARENAAAVDVVACDVNPAAIARAKQGRYTSWSMRETPAPLRQRYFSQEGTHHVLASAVRDAVRFEQRNLVEDDAAFWQPDSFDVVFCRNVVMYFGADGMRAVVDRIARALRPGGFLFMGHAETLRGVSRAFHLCHTHETFYYRRKAAHDLRDLPEEVHVREASRTEALPMAVALGLDSSWIDVIQRASERVTELTSARVPSPVPADPHFAPRADNAPVLEMMRRERFEEALELLSTSSPSDAETQLLRAVLLTNSGRDDDAERVCTELLARDELNAGAHYLLALRREHAGDAGAAREHDRIASYVDPSFAMPHVHMGLMERRAGHADRAAAELRVALDLLETEDASRILLFGGGFSRQALTVLCKNELQRCGAA